MPQDEPRDKWVNIYICRNRQEAVLPVAKLQANGLVARADGQEMSVISGFVPGEPNLIRTKIHVLERDAAAALAILKEVERRRAERRHAIPCPKCGAIDPDRIWNRTRLACMAVFVLAMAMCFWEMPPLLIGAIGFIAFGGSLWPYTPRWRCKQCGTQWIAPDPDTVVSDDDDDDDGDDSVDEDADDNGDDAAQDESITPSSSPK